MALIKCPECGRENVSDSAEACPECGYGIKAHFERIKQEDIKQQQARMKEEYEKRRIENVKKPDKPSAFNGLMIFGILCLVGGVLCLVVPDMMIFSVFEFAIGGWLCYDGNKQYEKEKASYELSLRNFEAYQREKIREQDEERRREEIRIANSIKCPVCGSSDTERITSVNRAVSIATVGLASGKIGKQYRCKKCKHMW